MASFQKEFLINEQVWERYYLYLLFDINKNYE